MINLPNKKYLLLLVLPLIALGVILLKDNKTADISSSTDNNLDKLVADKTVSPSLLVIDGLKCIGCGRCAKTAPTNFKMNDSSRKAVVISSLNVNSPEVKLAISNCPVAAISLN